MENVKRSLVAVLALVVVLGFGVQSGMAANLTNDDFSGSTLGDQWDKLILEDGNVNQAGGVLTCTVGTDAALDRAGIEMDSNYQVGAGDFCIQIDMDVTESANLVMWDKIHMICSEGHSAGDSTACLSFSYYDSNRWYYQAYIYVGQKENSSNSIIFKQGTIWGGNNLDWQIKFERKTIGEDTGVGWYARKLGSTGDWTTLYERTCEETQLAIDYELFSSDTVLKDVDIKLIQGQDGSGFTANLDNFMVPEPASASILLLGAVALLRRRKK